jgi:hypothetical protein
MVVAESHRGSHRGCMAMFPKKREINNMKSKSKISAKSGVDKSGVDKSANDTATPIIEEPN